MTETAVQQAVRIARAILEDSTPLFLGCRALCGPLNQLGIDREEPFVTIIAVESETDTYPIIPSDRKMWNPDRLAEKDAKLTAYQSTVQERVFVACREVVNRFGHEADVAGNWSVHRIDDNGNVFLVQAHAHEAEAQRIVAEFEAHGHKQTYWAEQDRAE